VTQLIFIRAALFILFTSLIHQPKESLFGLRIIFLGLPSYFYSKGRPQ
jgi:hypothetical protein